MVILVGIEGGNCYDDEQLSRPIKRFIAEYVRKQVSMCKGFKLNQEKFDDFFPYEVLTIISRLTILAIICR